MPSYKDEYNKQLTRIKRFIKQAEQRGYKFDFEIPAPPKRITKASVDKLTKITPSKLYDKATYTTLDGEILTGKQGREYERTHRTRKAHDTSVGFVQKQLNLQRRLRREARREVQRKSASKNIKKAQQAKIYDATRRTYDAFYDNVIEWEYGSSGQELNGHMLRQFIDDITDKYGVDVIAQTVKMLADDGISFGRMEAYNNDYYSDYVHFFLDRMESILGEKLPFDYYLKMFDGTGYDPQPKIDNDDEQNIINPYG